VTLDEALIQHRGLLLAHCYRMLGSLHDAEDAVQETAVLAWKSFPGFQERSSLKTWLYSIATRVCLNQLRHKSRRVVPSALGHPGTDPRNLDARAPELAWLEPLPTSTLDLDPADIVETSQSVRLAMVAALQHLTPKQRAVLILCDVLSWPARDVAELLTTTPAAVNSALQRARLELATLALDEDHLTEPTDPSQRALLGQYAKAFEDTDLAALEKLLTEDVRWEMPPVPTWFDGRNNVMELLRHKLRPGTGNRLVVETSANGQPAFAKYVRDEANEFRAHSLEVLTVTPAGIRAVIAFHRPDLFPKFGLPPVRGPIDASDPLGR